MELLLPIQLKLKFSVSSTFGDRDVFYSTVDSVGIISAEATWTGGASNLALILNGPGQVGYFSREDGPSPLSLSYTVTSADLSKGTDWTISIVNFGEGSAAGTVRIKYPIKTQPDSPPDISITSPFSRQTFTTNTITVSGIASDDIGLSKVEVRTDSGSWQLASGTTSWSKSITLNQGSNTIYARATDTSGKTDETSITINYQIPDVTPPDISITSPSSGQTFTTNTITVSGIASDDIGLSKVEVRTDSGSWQLASGTTSWSKSITLNQGSNTIYARATDTSGKTDETSITINYQIPDVTPPDISITSPSSGQTFTTNTITVSGIASGDIGLSKVEVRTDSGSWQLASGTTSWSKSITLNQGSNTIHARATDTSGNSNETSVVTSYKEGQDDTTVEVSVSPKSVELNKQSKVTITVAGTDGKGISGADVELETNLGKVDPASGTTNSFGFTSTFTSSDKGMATIKAQVITEGIVVASGETNVLVIPPTLNVLVSPESESVELNKPSKVTVTFTGPDGKGISGANVEMETNLGKVDPASGTTNSFGNFVSTFTSSEVGPATIKAQVITEGIVALDETNVQVIPPTLNVLVSPELASVKADKLSKVTVTVTGTDGKGISGANLKLKTNLGKVDPLSGTTDSSGNFVSTFTSSEEGTAEITANVITEGTIVASGETNIEVDSGFPWLATLVSIVGIVGIVILIKIIGGGGSNVGSNVGVPKPVPSSLNLQIEPGSIPADGKSTATVTIELQDEKGNAISFSDERIVELSTTLGTITSPIKILPGKTKVTATITAGQEPGTAEIVVLLSPAEGEKISLRVTEKIVFRKVAPIEAELDIQIEPDSIPADGISTAKGIIRIKDEKGNFISSPNGRTIELSTTLGTVTSPVKIQPGAQEEIATITSGQIAGTAKVTASSSPLKEATALVDFVPNEAGLDIQIEPESIPADGKSTAKITIKIKDARGDFIPSQNGRIVELSTTLGTITSPIKILPGEMEVTATITSGQIAGTAEVVASLSPVKGEEKSLRITGSITFTVPVSNEAGLDIQIEPESIPADGISTARGIIRIKDEKGNFISSPNGRTIELSTTLGTVTSPVKIQPGAQEEIATITSGQIAGTAKVTASSSPLKEATALVDFVPNEAGLDIQIEPESIPADGKSTAMITIKIKDARGDFIPSQNEKIVELCTTLGEVTSLVKIPSGAKEGVATITSGRVVGTAKVTASSSPLNGEGKSLHGEGKVDFAGLFPDESGPDVKNTP